MPNKDTVKRAPMRSLTRHAVFALLAVHMSLLAWSSWMQSPTFDEVGHVGAGVAHWHFGQFELYRVNPPLGRMLATVPVVLARPETNWTSYGPGNTSRPEFDVGRDFLEVNGTRSVLLLAMARWACLPFSVLGALACYRWARDLYGPSAGLLALCLWCFSPNILANFSLVSPDAAGTALGVAAAYAFWRWLVSPNWNRTAWAGALLGIAELGKTSWIVLLGLWPLLWLVCRPCRKDEGSTRGCEALQLATVLLSGVLLINAGYGFEGSFRRLASFPFISDALVAPAEPSVPDARPGNRFECSWIGRLPVPFPENYVLGIDVQKRDFERKMWSYLRGQWQFGGWWYYYLYALAIKVPLGTWLLLGLAVFISGLSRDYRAGWKHELVVLAPVLVIVLLVSSQTGISCYMRYVLPIFPFLFIWMSKVARAIDRRQWILAGCVAIAVVWSAASSLSVYPHSLSYFNALVGGPRGGPAHLLDSNIDWGQDLRYLKQWKDRHPGVDELGVTYFGIYDPRVMGLDCELPPRGSEAMWNDGTRQSEFGPMPGWYAVGVNDLFCYTKQYAYFRFFEPVDMAGYSIYIYHITADEANRVRLQLGLPELPALPDASPDAES